MWDIFFVFIGNIQVYFEMLEEYVDFYNLVEGGDLSIGYDVNLYIG